VRENRTHGSERGRRKRDLPPVRARGVCAPAAYSTRSAAEKAVLAARDPIHEVICVAELPRGTSPGILTRCDSWPREQHGLFGRASSATLVRRRALSGVSALFHGLYGNLFNLVQAK